MNMKKTIAAIAAGAVAVSAMATTTSALAAKTLTYNLVKSVKNQDAAGTVTATFTNVPLEAGGQLVIDPIAGNSWNTIVTISGSFWDDAAGTNKSFVPVVATGMDWETNWSLEGSKLWNDGAFADHGTVVVPIVAGTASGTNVALKATSSAVLTITVKYTDLPDSVSWAGALNSLIKEGKRGIKITSVGNASTVAAASPATKYVTDKNDDQDTTGEVEKVVRVADQSAVNELAGVTLQYDLATYTWKTLPCDEITVSGFNIEYNGAPVNCTLENLKKAGMVISAAGGMQGQSWANGTYVFGVDTVNNAFIDPADGSTAWQFSYTYGANAGWTVTMPGDTVTINFVAGPYAGNVDKTSTVNQAYTFIQAVEDNDLLIITKGTDGASGTLYASDISGAAVDTAGNTESKYPYHSTLQNSIYKNGILGGSLASATADTGKDGSGDVISWIGYANSDSALGVYDTKAYQISDAARSVINDAIQNYADIVFTFNTATSKVKDGKYSTDDDAVDYTAFGRHFWDRDTGYDTNTVYIYNDWIGNNLFEGALIINNNLTLSLGATDKFDWTATSLSFSWDAIQDTALTQNQYANYVQNMVLRTSTDWYWDNMTVTLGETETEEVDSGAPVEGNVEDLPEDEEEDFDIDLDEEDEEPAPVADVEPEPEPEPAPAAAPNPGTGNAPVALAVIPVALAAAAIVAKKRG